MISSKKPGQRLIRILLVVNARDRLFGQRILNKLNNILAPLQLFLMKTKHISDQKKTTKSNFTIATNLQPSQSFQSLFNERQDTPSFLLKNNSSTVLAESLAQPQNRYYSHRNSVKRLETGNKQRRSSQKLDYFSRNKYQTRSILKELQSTRQKSVNSDRLKSQVDKSSRKTSQKRKDAEKQQMYKRLIKIQPLCQKLAYKVGYLQGQLKEAVKARQVEKQKRIKQTKYLQMLADKYKAQLEKYKRLSQKMSGWNYENPNYLLGQIKTNPACFKF